MKNRNINFITMISSSFGRILKVDPYTFARLYFARLFISTKVLEVTNMIEELMVDDILCQVKVVEEVEMGLAEDARVNIHWRMNMQLLNICL